MAMDFTKSQNASNLKKIQQKGIENSNKVTAIDIPLDMIDKNEDNETIFNMSDIEFLADGIKELGFFGAIEVYKKPDGRYEISAGHRRYEAMKLLNRTTIPCIVSEFPDDMTRVKKLLTSNIRNRKLTPLEIARSIDYYQKSLKEQNVKGNFKTLVEEFFHITPAQLYRYQCLLKLIPELQELSNDPSFPYSSLREAAGLSEAGQKELYKKLTFFFGTEENNEDEKETRLTRPKIEQMISELRENEEYQSKPKQIHKRNVEEKKVINNVSDVAKDAGYNVESYGSSDVLEETTTESYQGYDVVEDTNVEPYKSYEEEVNKEEEESNNNNIIAKYFLNKIIECDRISNNLEFADNETKDQCIELLEKLIKKLKT